MDEWNGVEKNGQCSYMWLRSAMCAERVAGLD